jgi:hypothetical protein
MPKRLNDDLIRRSLRQADIRNADAGYSKRVRVIKSRKLNTKAIDNVSLPTVGQYSVSAGVYTFAVADEGLKVPLDEDGVAVASNTPVTSNSSMPDYFSWDSIASSNSIEDEGLQRQVRWNAIKKLFKQAEKPETEPLTIATLNSNVKRPLVIERLKQIEALAKEKEIKDFGPSVLEGLMIKEAMRKNMKEDLYMGPEPMPGTSSRMERALSQQELYDNAERLKALFARADNPEEKTAVESLSNGGQYQNTSVLRWVDPKIVKGYPISANFSFSGVIYSLAKSTLLRMFADASDAGITISNMMINYPFPLDDARNIFNISLNGDIPAYFIESWVLVYAKGGLGDFYSENYMQPAIQKSSTKKEITKVVAGQRAITLEEEV